MLCRNGIVDVDHPDSVQRNTLRGQPAEEAVGGVAVVLYGRRGKAAILAQPLLKDRDLCVMRMVLMFGFVEPAQEAQPFDSATDKACSRLGRRRPVAPASVRLRPDCGHGLDLRKAHSAAFFQVQKAHQAQLIVGAFPQGRSSCACLLEMNEISFPLLDKRRRSIFLGGFGKEDCFQTYSRLRVDGGASLPTETQ